MLKEFLKISQHLAKLKPNSITLSGSLVRSWFEPDSVMEFGFYRQQYSNSFYSVNGLVVLRHRIFVR